MSTVKLFADDTKLYSSIESEEDCNKLQHDIDNLSEWSSKWLLQFNVGKCKSLHIGRRNHKHQYHMDVDGERVNIAQVSEEKDIGVTFDDRMKFDKHISNIVSKANQRVGLIRRSFEFMDREMFLTLYKTLIRPTLEYATVIWSPWLNKHIVAIEQVQRRATRLVKDISNKTYEERLIELGLPTLMYRRERSDMIQMFKIMNKFDEVHLKSLSSSHSDGNRGHDMKIGKRHVNLKSTMNSFVPRSANNWNKLPKECVQSGSVNSFKNNLNVAWKHKQNKFDFKF